jgi:hypothetical protein
MKKTTIITLVIMILIFCTSIYSGKQIKKTSFTDLTEDAWYSRSVKTLAGEAIIPVYDGKFNGSQWQTRGEMMLYLYNFARVYLGEGKAETSLPFTDVTEKSPYYNAVCWAYEKGIASGEEDTLFAPSALCTRQEVCTFLMRMASEYNLTFFKKGNLNQFADSTDISPYAQSYVVSCKVAGIVKGDENQRFKPFMEITKGESALMLYNFKNSVNIFGKLNPLSIKPYDGIYNDLYKNFEKAPFYYYTEESGPVSENWFDNAVFIGDSVSVMLEYYSAATGALGDADFLCATSISPLNILNPVTNESIHPSVNGVKVSVPEGIKITKGKNIYVMLGINSLRDGIGLTILGMENLIREIKKVAPNCNIIIQSVTPITKGSNITSSEINNTVIEKYNKELRKLCQNKNLYYIDVAEAFKDSNGFLKEEYCSDTSSMGIHFTNKGAEKWAEYLKNHVPYKLKE